MANHPLLLQGSPSEQWNDYPIERATAIALGPDATFTMPNFRYLCTRCDWIVSRSRIIQSNLPDSGIIYDQGAPEEIFQHYENRRRLAQSAYRGCQICNLLHMASFGLPRFPYFWVITKNLTHVEINIKNEMYNLGATRLPTLYRTNNRALDGLIRSFSTDSDETFACAATWLRTCYQQHDICNTNTPDNGVRPQRLVKASMVNNELAIQLTPIEEIQGNIQYLALSHCWGEAQSLQLTRDQFNTFVERIPLESLPKTFLDAVVVTVRLGYQYIWIDALCIIQDCPRDRELEINRMGDIYRNCLCTIAALSARNSNEGCFVERDPLRCDNYQRQLYEFFLRVQDLDALPGPDCTAMHRPLLNTRAWVLQERLLSPRTLYYGSDMIYWECVRCRAFECRPRMEDLETGGEWLRGISGKKNAFNRLLEKCRSSPYNSWKNEWRLVLTEYSACQLSRDDDRCSAIQGVAVEVERQSRETLVHGLWQNHLQGELLWFAWGPGPGKILETQELRAPSWSWMSINGRIKWLEDCSAFFSYSHVEWTAVISLPANSGFSVRPATNSIIVEAPLINLAEIFPRDRGEPGLNPQSEHPNVTRVSWFPDTEESIDISPKWALQIARATRVNQYRVNQNQLRYFGLVVREVEDSPGTWERLGQYEIAWVQEHFRDSEPAPGLGTTETIMLV